MRGGLRHVVLGGDVVDRPARRADRGGDLRPQPAVSRALAGSCAVTSVNEPRPHDGSGQANRACGPTSATRCPREVGLSPDAPAGPRPPLRPPQQAGQSLSADTVSTRTRRPPFGSNDTSSTRNPGSANNNDVPLPWVRCLFYWQCENHQHGEATSLARSRRAAQVRRALGVFASCMVPTTAQTFS